MTTKSLEIVSLREQNDIVQDEVIHIVKFVVIDIQIWFTQEKITKL